MTIATLGINITSAPAVQGARDIERLVPAAQRAERAVDRMSARVTQGTARAATASAAYGKAMQASTMHTANLTAQLNDIGTMLAAGQSPLQLAMQQGTQINQVFAQMGGGMTALRGLGAAFVSTLNPMSLATIGIIAFGAAGVQWLMGLGGEAEDLEDRLESLGDATSAAREAVKLLGKSQAELRKEFAGTAEQVEALTQALGRRDLNDLNKEIAATAPRAFEGVAEEMKRINAEADEASRRAEEMGREFDGFSIEHVAARLGTTVDAAMLLTGALDEVNAAASSEERNQALLRTIQELEAMRDAAGFLPPLAQELYDGLVPIAGVVAEAAGQVRQLEDSLSGAAAEQKRMAQAYRVYQQSRAASDAGVTAAEAIARELTEEITLRAAIIQHGERSREVALLRASAERQSFEEMVKSLGVSRDLENQLMAAWGHAQALAQTDISGAITRGADEAARLAQNLAAAMAVPLTPAMLDEDALMGQPVLPTSDMREANRAAVANLVRLTTPKATVGRGGGGGGGASEAQREHNDRLRDAEQLYDSTRTAAEQYAMELGDVNELLRLGYIDADTAARATKMFGEQLRETGGLADTLSSSLADMFTGVITGAEDAGEAVRRLAESLAGMFLQQGFQSLMGNWFGGGPSFGGFRADGGPVSRGSAYVVGERGPEMFVAGQSGTIVPGVAAQGGTSIVEVRLSPELIAGVLAKANGDAVRIVEAGARQAERALPNRIAEHSRDRRKRF